jgi:hypothetical protein
MKKHDFKCLKGLITALLIGQVIGLACVMYEWWNLRFGAQALGEYFAENMRIDTSLTQVSGLYNYQHLHIPLHLSILPLTILGILLLGSVAATVVAHNLLTRAAKK